MADTDSTQDDDKKGGGVAGVVGGAGAAVVGGGLVARYGIKPQGIAEDLKKAKEELGVKAAAHKAAEDKLKENPENLKLFGTADAAKNLQAQAEREHHSLVSDKLNAEIKAAPPETMKGLRVASLNAQLDAIKKMPETDVSKAAKSGVEAQINAVTELKLSPADAHNELEKALNESWAKSPAAASAEMAAKTEALMGGVVKTKPVNDAVIAAVKKSSDAETVKKVSAVVEHPEVKATATKLENVTRAAEEAQKPWAKVAEAAKEQKTALDSATKEVEKLTKRHAAAIEGGTAAFFKKPGKLLAHGSGGQRLAIIVTSVALAVATYMGIKSFRNRERPESDADRVMQQAAAPDPSASAARG